MVPTVVYGTWRPQKNFVAGEGVEEDVPEIPRAGVDKVAFAGKEYPSSFRDVYHLNSSPFIRLVPCVLDLYTSDLNRGCGYNVKYLFSLQ